MSVNGLDEGGSPISLDVEFKKEQGMWRVNYMYLDFIESAKYYRQEAKCPGKG